MSGFKDYIIMNTSNKQQSNFNKINVAAYSSSPMTVFSDIDDAIYKEENEEDKIIKLHFQIVLKDLVIKYNEKLLKEYEHSHQMWTTFVSVFLK